MLPLAHVQMSFLPLLLSLFLTRYKLVIISHFKKSLNNPFLPLLFVVILLNARISSLVSHHFLDEIGNPDR